MLLGLEAALVGHLDIMEQVFDWIEKGERNSIDIDFELFREAFTFLNQSP